ncbi:MAG: ABC transporter ATP-binding protein [Lachnospiraceae bacterium]|nr:ABC transporter ATP-binding protein [Lachnospiraceae bacterium]
MLEVKNLSVWYTKDRPVICHADVTLKDHQVVGLLGVNGAGKTTLINTLSGVHTEFEAEQILQDGARIGFSDDAFKRRRYTVFTEEQAFGYWSFSEYKKYMEKVYQTRLDEQYVQYLVEGFRFQEYREQYMNKLSTGNRKKVFLILGFALRLPLLILDEPLDGLDFGAAEFLYEVLRGHKSCGSVLMSSHIAESIEMTCDEVLLLNQGVMTSKEIQDGTDIRKEVKEWLRDGD